jgi:molybdate/tungstate transport system permease protein
MRASGDFGGMPLVRVALGALLLLMLAPLATLAFAVPGPAVAAALARPETASALRTSLVASLCAVAVATVLGVPAGYAIARSAGAWRTVALFLLALPIALPPVASGIVLLALLGRNAVLGAFLAGHGLTVVDSLLGVIIAEFFVSGSFVAIAAAAAFADADRTIEEAARTLGASPLRVLLTIALPSAAPVISAGILLAWLRALGEYGATSILAYHPTSLPIELVVALSADGIPRALALAEAFVVLTAFAIGVATLLRRRIT